MVKNIFSCAIVLNGDVDNIEIKEEYKIFTDGAINKNKNIKCDVLIGDMDSSTNIENINCEKIYLPTKKDYTDGEKAIRFAYEKGIKNISIYNYRGGRSDHFYSNLSLLKIAKELNVNCKLVSSIESIYYFQEGETVNLDVEKNSFVSIIPYSDYVVVDNSNGLYYPLNNLKIPRDSTLGNSNFATKSHISFKIIQNSAFIFIDTEKQS